MRSAAQMLWDDFGTGMKEPPRLLLHHLRRNLPMYQRQRKRMRKRGGRPEYTAGSGRSEENASVPRKQGEIRLSASALIEAEGVVGYDLVAVVAVNVDVADFPVLIPLAVEHQAAGHLAVPLGGLVLYPLVEPL